MNAVPWWVPGFAACALVAWALVRLRVVVAVACGYKSKVLCTAILVCGRDMDVQTADEVAADNYLVLRPFRASVDRDRRTVTTTCLGFSPRTAVCRAGLGATLLPAGQSVPVESPVSPRAVATSEQPAARAARVAGGSDPIRRIVERAFEEPNPRRLRRTHAVVVVQDGCVIAERYARGVDADTPLPGWSVTKSVLSALVGLLVAEGRLSLTDRELMPGWRMPDPRAGIQLEDLLRMRSGLRFDETYTNPWSDVLHMLFDCGDTAGYAASRPLSAAPGSVWSYASGTSNILSAIVRRVVGSDYHRWPRRALFDRVGMPSAVLEADAAGTFVCSSFMVATARDWARFGMLWLDEGRSDGQEILPASWIRFSTTPTPQSPDGRYGAHWWLKLNPEVGGSDPAAASIAPDTYFAVGHEGQTLTIMPSKRLVVVRLGASVHIDAWNHAAFVAAIQEAL
ncbi:MAG: serine hydrolase [Vicinamibacterales bacterium]